MLAISNFCGKRLCTYLGINLIRLMVLSLFLHLYTVCIPFNINRLVSQRDLLSPSMYSKAAVAEVVVPSPIPLPVLYTPSPLPWHAAHGTSARVCCRMRRHSHAVRSRRPESYAGGTLVEEPRDIWRMNSEPHSTPRTRYYTGFRTEEGCWAGKVVLLCGRSSAVCFLLLSLQCTE